MNKPIRVLHLVGTLNRAGAETWLVSVLPHLLAENILCDFMVNEDIAYDYSETVRSFGSNILVCDEYQNRFAFAYSFSKLLTKHEPYDVVHCHTHWFSGLEVAVAALCGVKQRIVHAHGDTSLSDSTANFKRRSALVIMDRLIRYFSTGGLATSEKAGRSLLRRKWASSPAWRLHLSTSTLSNFQPREHDRLMRTKLGIAEGGLVVGNVGRFVPLKNHRFLLRVFRELLTQRPGSVLVCVGDGIEKPAISDLARDLGIQDKIKLIPGTDRVYDYVAGLFDLFVLPSLHEGLGIVAVEAQAAGIPTILSDRVPREASLIPELVTVLSLDESPQRWAQVMAAIQPVESMDTRRKWFEKVIETDFEPKLNASKLAAYYRSLLQEDNSRLAARDSGGRTFSVSKPIR